MITTIKGGISKDQRGEIRFVNDFDMTSVKRFYLIKNEDISLIRGWRAHKIERRWFYVISGKFKIDFIKINNWTSPDPNSEIESLEVSSFDQSVLVIPNGYGTAIQALEEFSELLVFADHNIEHATNDDYTWPLDYFKNI